MKSLKRFLLSVLLIASAGLAHADTTSANFGFITPTTGSTGWVNKVNDWIVKIDSGVAGLFLSNTFISSQTFQNNALSVGGSTFVVNGGFVGIGNAFPANLLDIKAAAKNTASILLEGTGTFENYMSFNNTGGTNYFGMEGSAGGGLATGSAAYSTVLSPSASRKLHLGYNGGTGVAVTVDSSGNVGVGTTSPAAPLDVSGRIQTSGTSATISSCGVGASVLGTATAGRITVGSGSPTTCSINFGQTYTNTPMCAFSSDSQTLGATVTETTTQLSIAHVAAFLNGEILKYVCIGR
jgi:hypothetical protein